MQEGCSKFPSSERALSLSVAVVVKRVSLEDIALSIKVLTSFICGTVRFFKASGVKDSRSKLEGSVLLPSPLSFL